MVGRIDRIPDIAIVPIAAETAASRQFVVAEPFSAKVPDAMPSPKWKNALRMPQTFGR